MTKKAMPHYIAIIQQRIQGDNLIIQCFLVILQETNQNSQKDTVDSRYNALFGTHQKGAL